jgi:ferredoxin
MTLVALIDPNVCSAHGVCEDVAPEIFRVDDIAVVIGNGPDELIIAAAAQCPTSAIRIVERETGEQIYP